MADDEVPPYTAREVRRPDGTRVIAAFAPDSPAADMTDEELLAEFDKVRERSKAERRAHLRVVRDDET